MLDRFRRALPLLAGAPNVVPVVLLQDATQHRILRYAEISTGLGADATSASVTVTEDGWYRIFCRASQRDTAAYAARRWIRAQINRVDGTNRYNAFEEFGSLLDPGDDFQPTFNGHVFYLEEDWDVRIVNSGTAFAAGEDLISAVHLVQLYQ